MPEFDFRSGIEEHPATVFKWFVRKGAAERLSPPWVNVRPLEESPHSGLVRRVIEMQSGKHAFRWALAVTEFNDGTSFIEEQSEGPFAAWSHEHRFIMEAKKICVLEDRVKYDRPSGVFANVIGEKSAENAIARLIRFRHERVRHDIARHKKIGSAELKTVAIAGASGLVGRNLVAFLRSGGHEVKTLVRRPADRTRDEIFWDPAKGVIDSEALEGIDVVINLAGESIAEKRWTDEQKTLLRESRILSTRLLAETLSKMNRRPQLFISASAVGIYGDRGSETLDENSGAGTGFLADLCVDWEKAAGPAADAGIRVVHPRIGVVFTSSGGALQKMLSIIHSGFGGKIGSGLQQVSWIAMDDLIGALHHVMYRENISGPVNAVSPNPITNGELTKTLASILKKPAFFSAPRFAVKALFGEMGTEMLLAGAKVVPSKLIENDFKFFYPSVKASVCTELGLTSEAWTD